MRHNQLTMIAPLNKDQREVLASYLEREIGYQRVGGTANTQMSGIAELHFISMFTFVTTGGDGGPEAYLILEANFDGPVNYFLAHFTTQLEKRVARLFRFFGWCG